jgi:hypothetical protein
MVRRSGCQIAAVAAEEQPVLARRAHRAAPCSVEHYREEVAMPPTVVGLFDKAEQAQQTVQDLLDNGVPSADISLVMRNPRDAPPPAPSTHAADTAERVAAGAFGGGVLGGVLGVLVGVSGLVIPGIGPILAAGPLAAAISSALAGASLGAVSGGLLGAMTVAGVPEEQAHAYAEGVRRGGTLVAVTTDAILGSAVYDLMRRHGVVDIDVRSATWRRSGWERFDPNAPSQEAP